MKKTITERILLQFEVDSIIDIETMKEICKTTNLVSGIMKSLKKRGYDVKILRNERGRYESFQLISYVKPFYLVSRDIEKNYPNIEKVVRLLYKYFR